MRSTSSGAVFRPPLRFWSRKGRGGGPTCRVARPTAQDVPPPQSFQEPAVVKLFTWPDLAAMVTCGGVLGYIVFQLAGLQKVDDKIQKVDDKIQKVIQKLDDRIVSMEQKLENRILSLETKVTVLITVACVVGLDYVITRVAHVITRAARPPPPLPNAPGAHGAGGP
eukprot:TRINITY_DN11012_c0_g1_i2.p3 TRINITY_DN11012_c0_g1~~TRINITY_DN11012_c0_g1_i2.p3  ORF type:complete len:167 (+),score=13.94 TRINITY_DN11012_c0_g1_i2:152-652(+)